MGWLTFSMTMCSYYSFPGIGTLVGVTGAAAAATGIGALLVIGIGLIAVISDAIRQSDREKQERQRKCNEWKQWCSWGKDLFTPAFSVTCIGDIFVHLSTCHLSTCFVTWPTSNDNTTDSFTIDLDF